MRKPQIPLLNPGEKIVLYKKGSHGEILSVHDTVQDIVDIERIFYHRFNNGSIYSVLLGRSKSFTSYNHRCRVKAVIRKFEEPKSVPHENIT